jgi:hypothetical protein
LYAHSLEVAYCGAALYCCHPIDEPLTDVLTAGLFHDLGLLHIDPQLLEANRPLSEAERRQIYSHPLTSFLILQNMKDWKPLIGAAVLEHHERLDGSGYPRGVAAAELGPLGRLLAVAEISASLLGQQASPPSARRLAVVLRLNRDKLHPSLIDQLTTRLLHLPPETTPAGVPNRQAVLAQLFWLARIQQQWQELFRGREEYPALQRVNHRLERLEHSLADVGADLAFWTNANSKVEFDAATGGELEAAAQEATWQLQAISYEIRRHWQDLRDENDSVIEDLQRWMTEVENPTKSVH